MFFVPRRVHYSLSVAVAGGFDCLSDPADEVGALSLQPQANTAAEDKVHKTNNALNITFLIIIFSCLFHSYYSLSLLARHLERIEGSHRL
jgi:hypothetical protein